MNHLFMSVLIKIAHEHSRINCRSRWLVVAIFWNDKFSSIECVAGKLALMFFFSFPSLFFRQRNSFAHKQTLSIIDMSKLNLLITRPKGVDWKKCNEFSMTEFTSRSWSRLREWLPANWADGVATNAKIIHKPDRAQ